MTFTREDFQREYNLSDEDVRETAKACGLSLKKRNYSDEEKERFAQARKLFDEGTANSYDDIANYFKNNGIQPDSDDDGLDGNASDELGSDEDSSNGNGLIINEKLAEDLRLLEAQAMETGFQMGLQQAEIMGKVIPQVTILRLKEMIVTGELKQNFQQIWSEATKTLGNAQSLTEQVEGRWKEYQLLRYQPPTSLPSSSTESSNSDY
ncbi:hypothetical protein [Gloeothece verrucosa]|uniref:Uncharacterized protein n=1 Tax=Gloeothece verrucosa (strain PCC 7822) TaxID=497965 RepID=E0UD90_GLOV7|nr:hypothetical protein [Gloeothece verrucosa]ADN12970.1 hypothetical protein Cyan7822_0958 [Gloeothece verrucosa PCC 7822]